MKFSSQIKNKIKIFAMNNFAGFLDLLIYLFSLKQSDNNYNFLHQPQLLCVQHLKVTKIIVNTLLSVEMHAFKRKDALDLWSLLFQRPSESALPKHNKHHFSQISAVDL